MSSGYTPSLIVDANTTIVKIRELPLQGKATVNIGDHVNASDVVLSAERPGDLAVVKLADKLGCTPERALGAAVLKEGDAVTRGQKLAELKLLFGLMTDMVISPCDGVIEYILASTAHVGIRQAPKKIEVHAYISGKVTAVDKGKRVTVETEGALVQGIFGVGGERFGELECIGKRGRIDIEDLRSKDLKGKIIAGGDTFSVEALEYLSAQGGVGAITASINSRDLKKLLGRDLGVSMTGDEHLSFSLIVTEGFGSLEMSPRTIKLLKELSGNNASINGATQVRAGAMRPELIVTKTIAAASTSSNLKSLDIGTAVRCIRAPYFGELGEILELPVNPEEVDSGAIVRVAKVKLKNRQTVTIPRANLECL